MKTAAVALLLGIEPLEFLALAPDDFLIAQEVVKQAHQLRADQDRKQADYISARTAGLTAQAITKWLGKNLPRLARGP